MTKEKAAALFGITIPVDLELLNARFAELKREYEARATDSKGAMQPHQAGFWNPQGYGGNAMHRVAVLVG